MVALPVTVGPGLLSKVTSKVCILLTSVARVLAEPVNKVVWTTHDPPFFRYPFLANDSILLGNHVTVMIFIVVCSISDSCLKALS